MSDCHTVKQRSLGKLAWFVGCSGPNHSRSDRYAQAFLEPHQRPALLLGTAKFSDVLVRRDIVTKTLIARDRVVVEFTYRGAFFDRIWQGKEQTFESSHRLIFSICLKIAESRA